MSAPGLDAALSRAGIGSNDSAAMTLVRFGLARYRGDESDILEVTRATWQNETHGGAGIVLLTSEGLSVVLAPVTQGRFRPRTSPPACVQLPFAMIRDLIENDDDAPIIWFVGADGASDFFLRFERSAERDRMVRPIFLAHRGDLSTWAPQLDPAAVRADFARCLAELQESGPAEPHAVRGWVQDTYTSYTFDNALGLAAAWQAATLEDRAGGTPSARVRLISDPWLWIEGAPDARRVVLRLSEALYDEGLLGPPYDERTFETGEPLTGSDAGPARLLAVAWLAALAGVTRDPRAEEFAAVFRASARAVPPSVFPPRLREFWSDEPLPEVGPMRGLEIWEDADVATIATVDGDRVQYDTTDLTASDRAHVDRHMDAMSTFHTDPNPVTLTAACLAGVRTYEDLSPLAPVGWRKFVLHNVSEHAHRLWHEFAVVNDTAMLAQWVTVTIQAGGWGPDGNATPLGQHHSYSMNLAQQTGVGIVVIDPETGRASVPTGDQAREASKKGHF